jgi:predicted nuclease of predicted toxin-antitoxin system
MRLLLDQNLSPRLVYRLADLFPGSAHVSTHGLEQVSDRDVWEFARRHGFTLISKDSDFADISILLGCPPRVIWLRIGNCTAQQIEALLRRHASDIEAFENEEVFGVLALM